MADGVPRRLGYIPEDITDGFRIPRVLRTIMPTFSDEQIEEEVRQASLRD